MYNCPECGADWNPKKVPASDPEVGGDLKVTVCSVCEEPIQT
jgi:hypothetical protein